MAMNDDLIEKASNTGNEQMIVPEPNEQFYGVEMEEVLTPQLTLFIPASERVSDILGPDGDLLRVGVERPAIGFDLRKRADG